MLAAYLEYAQQGGRPPTQAYGSGEPESDFEYDVRDQLVARGFEVDAQVGSSGFRVDLAIRNPLHKERYVLGVECDGATYHSQRSARDRDRLRQAVLEGLGWKIYRVWSTDWVKEPASIIDRIADRVKELQEAGPTNAGVLGPNMGSVREDETIQLTEPDWADADDRNPPTLNSGESPQYGFKPYVEYQEKGKRLNDTGYIVLAIVERETPIHVDALIRRVGEMYGLRRVSPKNRKLIMSYVRQAAARQKFQIRNGFCWVGYGSSPRVPPPGSSPRPIQEIALEELMEAARTIVAKERGVPRQSLVREVGRVFGYRRTGEKVDVRVQQAIERLYEEGVFSTYGNQVILAPKAP
jgi:very-short-patch-repair endonuclease